MTKFKVMLVALAATAVVAAGQVGVAQALNCGSGTASKAILSGTFTLNFLGGGVEEDGNDPAAESGSVTVDGKGDVTGGVIRCNIGEAEYVTTISGGCYTINSDGTGFMAITTDDRVCDQRSGVDLQLAISYAGNQFQFTTQTPARHDASGRIRSGATCTAEWRCQRSLSQQSRSIRTSARSASFRSMARLPG